MGFHQIQHCIGGSDARVTLIIPPSPFLLDERVFPSLGILRVAAALEEGGHEVDVLDFSGTSDYVERAGKLEPGIFGITATTPQLPAAISIAKALPKESWKILGGPHVTMWNRSPRAKVDHRLFNHFDCLVAGDGEKAIFPAMGHKGIIDADDPKSSLWVDNPPFPARHLIDLDSYHYEIDGERATSLIAQLGCPFGCGFCGGRLSPSFRRTRQRPVEDIIEEIEHITLNCIAPPSTGYRGIMFYDDELNVNPQMIPLMRAIKELNLGLKLRGFVKAELFTDEQAEAMVEAGFKWILVGFESGCERILKNINKKATLADNTRCMEIAHKHGLKVKALMSLGHPGESEESAMDTQCWLIEQEADDFDVTIITTYPGTPYYDNSVPHGRDLGQWVYEVNGDRLYSQDVDYLTTADYYKGSPNSYVSYVWTDELDRKDLVWWRNMVERTVRQQLGIPYPKPSFEHSMGQN